MRGYAAPWAYVDEPGYLYYSTDGDEWQHIGPIGALPAAKDEPQPDTPRNPLPKPKEPPRKDEREVEDPREKRWL